MRRIGWITLVVVAFVVILCCWAVSMIELPEHEILGGEVDELPASFRSGASPPGGGTCASIGVLYEDDPSPFTGWPVKRYYGEWKTISAWFCDPDYFKGYTHWGIDLAAMTLADKWYGIHGAEVVCTAERAVVVGAADDGGPHWGMGNHVILKHVTCERRCVIAPDEPPEDHHYFLIERGALECTPPTPTPGAPSDEDPIAPALDLVLDCTESGWKASYFHLLSVSVGVGQLVKWGDVLGTINSTGNSTGDHLHYQLNSPTHGAIDPAPTMCTEYDDSLRTVWRWERPTCPDYSQGPGSPSWEDE